MNIEGIHTYAYISVMQLHHLHIQKHKTTTILEFVYCCNKYERFT